MQFSVIGASGLAGLPLVKLASARGISVKALVRKEPADKVPGVDYILGSPLIAEDVKRALAGSDIVAVMLGMNLARNSKGKRNPFGKMESPADLFSKSAEAYLPIAKAAGVKRIIYFSAYGVGEEYKTLPLVFRIIIRLSAIKYAYRDHETAEKMIRASGIPFTILHPGFLTEADEVHPFVRTPGKNQGGISRKTVAQFILDTAISGTDLNASVPMFGPSKP